MQIDSLAPTTDRWSGCRGSAVDDDAGRCSGRPLVMVTQPSWPGAVPTCWPVGTPRLVGVGAHLVMAHEVADQQVSWPSWPRVLPVPSDGDGQRRSNLSAVVVPGAMAPDWMAGAVAVEPVSTQRVEVGHTIWYTEVISTAWWRPGRVSLAKVAAVVTASEITRGSGCSRSDLARPGWSRPRAGEGQAGRGRSAR